MNFFLIGCEDIMTDLSNQKLLEIIQQLKNQAIEFKKDVDELSALLNDTTFKNTKSKDEELKTK